MHACQQSICIFRMKPVPTNPHQSLRCLQSEKQKFNIEASFQNSSPINRAKKEPIHPLPESLTLFWSAKFVTGKWNKRHNMQYEWSPNSIFTSVVGYQQNRISHFHRKTTRQGNITAHGPSRSAQALLYSKPKPKDNRPSPQCSSASSDPSPSRPTPVMSSRRPTLVTSSRRSTPLHSYCFARPSPTVNILPRVCTGPYSFLLRNRSSSRRAGLSRNL
jgi:hypothetical protein